VKKKKIQPVQLKPNPKCKDCWGRGYILVIRPDLNVDKYREARPCHCVKTIVDITDGMPTELEQKLI